MSNTSQKTAKISNINDVINFLESQYSEGYKNNVEYINNVDSVKSNLENLEESVAICNNSLTNKKASLKNETLNNDDRPYLEASVEKIEQTIKAMEETIKKFKAEEAKNEAKKQEIYSKISKSDIEIEKAIKILGKTTDNNFPISTCQKLNTADQTVLKNFIIYSANNNESKALQNLISLNLKQDKLIQYFNNYDQIQNKIDLFKSHEENFNKLEIIDQKCSSSLTAQLHTHICNNNQIEINNLVSKIAKYSHLSKRMNEIYIENFENISTLFDSELKTIMQSDNNVEIDKFSGKVIHVVVKYFWPIFYSNPKSYFLTDLGLNHH